MHPTPDGKEEKEVVPTVNRGAAKLIDWKFPLNVHNVTVSRMSMIAVHSTNMGGILRQWMAILGTGGCILRIGSSFLYVIAS